MGVLQTCSPTVTTGGLPAEAWEIMKNHGSRNPVWDGTHSSRHVRLLLPLTLSLPYTNPMWLTFNFCWARQWVKRLWNGWHDEEGGREYKNDKGLEPAGLRTDQGGKWRFECTPGYAVSGKPNIYATLNYFTLVLNIFKYSIIQIRHGYRLSDSIYL